MINKVIAENQCSVIYICDSVDNLEKYRDGIFKGWHKENESEKELITRAYYLEDNDITHYVGVIPYNDKCSDKIQAEMDDLSFLKEKN